MAEKDSFFFLTVNTQQNGRKYGERLSAACRALAEDVSPYIRFMAGSHPELIDSLEVIMPDANCTADSVTSTSHKGTVTSGKWHIHFAVEVVHRTRVQLNIKKLTAYFCKALRLEGIHFDLKLYKRADRQNIYNYIRKHVEKPA